MAKLAAEEEEKKKAAEAAAEKAALEAAAVASAAAAVAAAEAAAKAAALEAQRNGICTVRYNHYKKPIQVSNGETTSFLVDAQLCLSFVFKSCQLHLVETDPEAKAPAGEGASSQYWVPERPGLPPSTEEECECTCRSTIYTLKAGCTYWAVVEEDSAEKAAADARAREGMEKFKREQEAREAAKAAGGGVDLEKTEKVEGCSCIWVSTAVCVCVIFPPIDTPRSLFLTPLPLPSFSYHHKPPFVVGKSLRHAIWVS